MSFEIISVVGLGYIGLPTAAMFASRKKRVIGLDVNQHTVDKINRGEIHIVEPELDILVHTAVMEGFLRATTVAEAADAFLIAVPTPLKKNSGDIPDPDLSYIQAAAVSIAPVLKKGDLVILESTSPVGATEQLAEWLAQERSDLNFPQTHGDNADVNVAHCPERVLPGHVVRELVENDRVIGGMSSKCSEKAVQLYKTFVKGECVVTNARSAEMVKLTENSCRDVQIAFANELSIICDKLDIDVWELISLANRHPRINILQPGPGVGGHCIAVDPWFIVSKTPNEAKIIRAAREINDFKPHWVLQRLEEIFIDLSEKGHVNDRQDLKVACLGLAFKADIDDLRESPSLGIAMKIMDLGFAKPYGVEPNINVFPSDVSDKVTLVSYEEAICSANVILLLVDHKEFRENKISLSEQQFLIDTRGLYSKRFSYVK